jgi:hypothetical protein
MMRVRDLRFGTVDAWPPMWRAVPGRRFVLGDEGVLLGVRVRSRDSLILRILAHGEEYEGLFVWDGRPSPHLLAEIMNAAAGKAIREIGDLRLPDETWPRDFPTG